ncbi:MAG: prepilin peptidase [Pirellulaceae bacterium]|nr:prepilin peptidase [Pirellulaceae bacterium]
MNHRNRTENLTRVMLGRRRRLAIRKFCIGLIVVSTLATLLLTGGLFEFHRQGLSFQSTYDVQSFWVSRLFEWFLGIWVFIVGSCIASFLNVVAYRVPAGLPITGTSFCPHCNVPILPSDNVPVLGWFILGGRCRSCKLSISPRYPTFEFIGGLLLLSVYLSTVLGHGRNLPWNRQIDLAYGLPMNLHFMDEAVFYIAGLHIWLLLFLYAEALTSLGHGRMPLKVWLFGALGILTAIALRPELCVLPISERETSMLPLYVTESPRYRAILTSVVGSMVAAMIASIWRVRSGQSTWIAACSIVGLALGWQASIGILFLTAVAFTFGRFDFANSKNPTIFLPIQRLWLWTAIFLMTWRWFSQLSRIF